MAGAAEVNHPAFNLLAAEELFVFLIFMASAGNEVVFGKPLDFPLAEDAFGGLRIQIFATSTLESWVEVVSYKFYLPSPTINLCLNFFQPSLRATVYTQVYKT